MPTPITLAHLRAHAVVRSLFRPTSLPQALRRLGFVQADPIRAPARAQDLVLRQRVKGYRAGDLEARYPQLDLEEDFFVNYGFVPRATHALMHPRPPSPAWPAARQQQAAAVLAFVHANGVVHPRAVHAEFAHGKAQNWFGGRSNASTQLLDAMHQHGLLRIARRDAGVRLYAARLPSPAAAEPQAAMDALVDVIVQHYAPLPARTLSALVSRLRSAAPRWPAPGSACRRRAQPAWSGTGQRVKTRPAKAMQPMTRCTCWRRLTRSSEERCQAGFKNSSADQVLLASNPRPARASRASKSVPGSGTWMIASPLGPSTGVTTIVPLFCSAKVPEPTAATPGKPPTDADQNSGAVL